MVTRRNRARVRPRDGLLYDDPVGVEKKEIVRFPGVSRTPSPATNVQAFGLKRHLPMKTTRVSARVVVQ